MKLQFELAPRTGGSVKDEGPAVEILEDGEGREVSWDHEEQGRSGSARLYRLTSRRELIVRAPGEPPRHFPLAIPRDPSRASAEWSSWTGRSQGDSRSIRYRMIR